MKNQKKALNPKLAYTKGKTGSTVCGMQIVISIFSIFAVSIIQQNTPNHLLGKIMAYTSAITLCIQPVGQMIYGFLFDRFKESIYFILILTGEIIFLIGLFATGFFKDLEQRQPNNMEGNS